MTGPLAVPVRHQQGAPCGLVVLNGKLCVCVSGARTRASIAVSTFDHSNPFKPGAVTSDPAPAGLVSSGLLGPLNLHMYRYTTVSCAPRPGPVPCRVLSNKRPSPSHSHALATSSAESSFITSGIEEDEQEHETASQPSMSEF